MRASELIGREVCDAGGVSIGVVHDLRAVLPATGHDDRTPGGAADPAAVPRVVSLVVGPATLRCRLAHAWGFAQRHQQGPALLRALVGRAGTSRVVAVAQVGDWDDDGRIRLTGGGR